MYFIKKKCSCSVSLKNLSSQYLPGWRSYNCDKCTSVRNPDRNCVIVEGQTSDFLVLPVLKTLG